MKVVTRDSYFVFPIKVHCKRLFLFLSNLDSSRRGEHLEIKNATITNEIKVHASLVDADLVRDDIVTPGVESQYFPSHASNINHDNAAMVDDPFTIIMETADKAVQTDCFCQCYMGGSNDRDMKQLLEEMGNISAEMKDLKLNITGKTVVKKMRELFPIKSETDLVKIDHNIDNTENFELRLRLYLKYLKPKSSSIISTAFKELIDDGFLKGKNWDGSNKMQPLNKFKFFETILFDAWKNSTFTKNVYISAMKEEIKRSHDRERKRAK
ncbi:uncharacterized protein LOC119070307 [Bradysia coprophila]|uniref:uncharacterized protein LOC119070307 n=1 Tax=Bradysia coprophila TaxID=38358 RepID=UPI00187DB0DC|nr:uncharacterized protein LOC119070307 [Bradysia coprophila]